MNLINFTKNIFLVTSFCASLLLLYRKNFIFLIFLFRLAFFILQWYNLDGDEYENNINNLVMQNGDGFVSPL